MMLNMAIPDEEIVFLLIISSQQYLAALNIFLVVRSKGMHMALSLLVIITTSSTFANTRQLHLKRYQARVNLNSWLGKKLGKKALKSSHITQIMAYLRQTSSKEIVRTSTKQFTLVALELSIRMVSLSTISRQLHLGRV